MEGGITSHKNIWVYINVCLIAAWSKFINVCLIAAWSKFEYALCKLHCDCCLLLNQSVNRANVNYIKVICCVWLNV